MANPQSFELPTIPKKIEKSEKLDEDIIEFTLTPEVLERINSLKDASEELKQGFQDILVADQKRYYQRILNEIKNKTSWKIKNERGFWFNIDLDDIRPSSLDKIVAQVMKSYTKRQFLSLKWMENLYQRMLEKLKDSVNKNEKKFSYFCGWCSSCSTEAEALQKYKDIDPKESQLSELFVRELSTNEDFKNPKFGAQSTDSTKWNFHITCDIEYS